MNNLINADKTIIGNTYYLTGWWWDDDKNKSALNTKVIALGKSNTKDKFSFGLPKEGIGGFKDTFLSKNHIYFSFKDEKGKEWRAVAFEKLFLKPFIK